MTKINSFSFKNFNNQSKLYNAQKYNFEGEIKMDTKAKTVVKKDDGNKPTNRYTIFPITVTEWENEGIKSYTISKSYKDKEGNWENTTTFSEADLCVVGKIISKI